MNKKVGMIRKNDILKYAENLEKGDEYSLMLAVDDECVPEKIPMVKVVELNTNLPLPGVNFWEAKNFKVVGHLQDGEDTVAVIRKYLPKDKWLFTDDLWKKNFRAK